MELSDRLRVATITFAASYELADMRVTLIIFSLGGGGAQRVISNMANYWAKHNWAVTLVTYGDGSASDAYELHPAVAYRQLGIKGRSGNPIEAIVRNLKRLLIIRKAIKNTDPRAVISFLDKINVRTILSCLGLGCPVIVSERVDPAHHSIGRVWSILRRLSYRYATRIVTQTAAAMRYFPESIQQKGRVIPNPLAIPKECRVATYCLRRKIVMGMGRLTHQKGFDLLLRAFSIASSRHLEWSLAIWGEGDARGELESLCDELGLQGRVKFAGWTDEPLEEMRRAGIFVLSSRYEGFPNVLCEAMACALPVVSFDCPSGPSQIIRDGMDGVLVPPGDVHALASVMDRLMEHQSVRARLGANAVDVVERFGMERVMEMWESVVSDAIVSRRGKAGK